jgi:predicted nucleotidyltransferase
MDSPGSTDFAELIARVARALRGRRLPFMLIGGQAVLVHGEPRLTQDVDITLAASPERLNDALEACATAKLSPLPRDVAEFVRDTFVLPASDLESGIRVDFVFSTTPFEAEAIRRAVSIDVGGTPVPFASPEDLILHKLFAGRPRDLEDAAGVVRRKAGDVDWGYIRKWAREFSVVSGRETLPEQVDGLERGADREG